MGKVVRFRGRQKNSLMEVKPITPWGKTVKGKASKAQIQAMRWRKDMVARISFHGRRSALKGADLSKLEGKSKSYLIKVIQRMVLEEGQAIGSGPDGYFWILTGEDREMAIRWLTRRGITSLRRAAVLSETHIQKVFMDAWREEYERLSDHGRKILQYELGVDKRRSG
jgi:hypothetical protein